MISSNLHCTTLKIRDDADSIDVSTALLNDVKRIESRNAARFRQGRIDSVALGRDDANRKKWFLRPKLLRPLHPFCECRRGEQHAARIGRPPKLFAVGAAVAPLSVAFH
uniref:Uncharacterized protein n=1 Tax=Plectus sambesii TaxID=2011161 RepID=A0A914UWL1_9BILA